MVIVAKKPPKVDRVFADAPRKESPPRRIHAGIIIASLMAATQEKNIGKDSKKAIPVTISSGIEGFSLRNNTFPWPCVNMRSENIILNDHSEIILNLEFEIFPINSLTEDI